MIYDKFEPMTYDNFKLLYADVMGRVGKPYGGGYNPPLYDISDAVYDLALIFWRRNPIPAGVERDRLNRIQDAIRWGASENAARYRVYNILRGGLAP